jgi:SSS family solute:Na+ symporter
LPRAAAVGVKGGWLTVLDTYPSENGAELLDCDLRIHSLLRADDRISLLTRPRDEKSLVGLVYALTPREVAQETAWYARPGPLGVAVLVAMILLNLWFW